MVNNHLLHDEMIIMVSNLLIFRLLFQCAADRNPVVLQSSLLYFFLSFLSIHHYYCPTTANKSIKTVFNAQYSFCQKNVISQIIVAVSLLSLYPNRNAFEHCERRKLDCLKYHCYQYCYILFPSQCQYFR